MSGTASYFAEGFWAFLEREYLPRRNAAKILGRKADASPRTAESWLAKRSLPQGEHLFALMARCDGLKAEIDRLVEEARCRDQ